MTNTVRLSTGDTFTFIGLDGYDRDKRNVTILGITLSGEVQLATPSVIHGREDHISSARLSDVIEMINAGIWQRDAPPPH